MTFLPHLSMLSLCIYCEQGGQEENFWQCHLSPLAHQNISNLSTLFVGKALFLSKHFDIYNFTDEKKQVFPETGLSIQEHLLYKPDDLSLGNTFKKLGMTIYIPVTSACL